MQENDKWLEDYGKNQRRIRHTTLHRVASILLLVGTVGVLWWLPVPGEFARISPILNWGSLFMMAALVYYFIISMPLAIGMLPFAFTIAAMQLWLSASTLPALQLSAASIVAGLIAMRITRHTYGGASAVFADIQQMIIAPLWMLSVVYRRLGIPY